MATEERSAPENGSAAFDLSPALVERLQARDESAYAELFRVAFTPLAQFAYGYLQSYEAAEDVVQEVMCRLWSLGPRWPHNASPRAYLYSAVRNGAINILRHTRVTARHEREVLRAVASDVSLGAVAPAESDNALADRLRTALAALTDRQRSAFELRYLRGLTVAEVATVLGVSKQGAEKLLSRTLHTLRGQLTHLR